MKTKGHKPIKALVACNHPGGARAVLPVVEMFIEKKPEIIFDLFLTSHALPIFDLPSDLVNTILVDETFSRETREHLDLTPYTFVLCGTSIDGNLEKSVVQAALKQSVPVFSILDHWCEYAVRFGEPGGELNAVPNTIFVPDKIGLMELMEIGISEDHIVVSGHPAFDRIMDAKKRFSKDVCHKVYRTLGWENSTPMIVFVSEPVQSDHGAKHLDYSEFTTLKMICTCLDRLEIHVRPRLVVKLHPREEASKFQGILEEFGQLKITLVQDKPDRFDLMLCSRLVLGISSLMLLEGSILGIPTYSLEPYREGRSFIGQRLGWVARIDGEKELENLLTSETTEALSVTISPKKNASFTIFKYILSILKL